MNIKSLRCLEKRKYYFFLLNVAILDSPSKPGAFENVLSTGSHMDEPNISEIIKMLLLVINYLGEILTKDLSDCGPLINCYWPAGQQIEYTRMKCVVKSGRNIREVFSSPS